MYEYLNYVAVMFVNCVHLFSKAVSVQKYISLAKRLVFKVRCGPPLQPTQHCFVVFVILLFGLHCHCILLDSSCCRQPWLQTVSTQRTSIVSRAQILGAAAADKTPDIPMNSTTLQGYHWCLSVVVGSIICSPWRTCGNPLPLARKP